MKKEHELTYYEKDGKKMIEILGSDDIVFNESELEELILATDSTYKARGKTDHISYEFDRSNWTLTLTIRLLPKHIKARKMSNVTRLDDALFDIEGCMRKLRGLPYSEYVSDQAKEDIKKAKYHLKNAKKAVKRAGLELIDIWNDQPYDQYLDKNGEAAEDNDN